MAEAIRIGDPAIEVRLRRHPRARRMVLRIGHGAEAAVLTLPPSVSLGRARAFALDQEGWLRSRLAATPGRVAVRAGLELPFRDGVVRLLPTEGRRFALAEGALMVPGSADMLPVRAAAFLREEARRRCLVASEAHAARLGRRVGRLSLRDTRGRWGSCTAAGDLMFCWRLILAPDAVLDYVAAHEVAHLVEMNHSPRFWSVVAGLRPDFAEQREWLRRHGPRLMAYDFTAAEA